jgi:hypothetical protein
LEFNYLGQYNVECIRNKINPCSIPPYRRGSRLVFGIVRIIMSVHFYPVSVLCNTSCHEMIDIERDSSVSDGFIPGCKLGHRMIDIE